MTSVRTPAEVTFFAAPEEFRLWLEANHEIAPELWVGYHRKSTGRPSMTWEQSVDQALCFGWIDGIRKGLDGEAYTIRFTPRRRTSTWSAVNLRRVPELAALGLMRPAGMRAYEERDRRRDRTYSYETPPQDFPAGMRAEFESNREAWAWFSAQPPGYRRSATSWVASAKQEVTRARRLVQLIEESAAGRRLGALTPPGRKGPRTP